MSFESYMMKNFSHFDLANGEMTVNGGWLKGFWLAAQNDMLRDTCTAIRAENPAKPIRSIDDEWTALVTKQRLNVWLDDIRQMPEDYDIHVKTADECIELIKANRVARLSFDHDLGMANIFKTGKIESDVTAPTGYDVAKVVEQLAFEGKILPFEWQIHSMNPIGVENIERAMTRADEHWRAAEAMAEAKEWETMTSETRKSWATENES